jgi:hypothetical protein
MRWEGKWGRRAGIVTSAKVAGTVIIFVGLGLTIWEIADFDSGISGDLGEYRARFFIRSMLSYLASGGLLIIAAEIADRLGWGAGADEDDPGQPS